MSNYRMSNYRMSNYWKSNFQTSNFQTSKITKRRHSVVNPYTFVFRLRYKTSQIKGFFAHEVILFDHGHCLFIVVSSWSVCSGMDPTCRSLCMVPHWSARVPSCPLWFFLYFIRDLMWFCQDFILLFNHISSMVHMTLTFKSSFHHYSIMNMSELR